MTDNVKVFPAHESMNPEQALKHTLNTNPEYVITVGYDHDDNFFSYTSKMDRKTALWLCKKLENHILDVEGMRS